VTERHLLLLLRGLLLAVSMVSVVSVILAISSVSRVDFPIVLLLLHGPLATRLKKLSLGFGNLDACVSHREQIVLRLGLLHGDLLHGIDVVDSVTKDVDDLNVLDVWGSIAEPFYVILEALIMLA
jgi:hypothetical protein